MANSLNASNTGIQITPDGSGVFQFQANGISVMSLNSSGAIGFGPSPVYGTAGQVLTTQGSAAVPTWGGVSNTAISGIMLPSQGGTGLTSFAAGTNYVAPGTATTFTAYQNFTGSNGNLAASITNLGENANVSATGAGANTTVHFDLTSQSVMYYTTNAAGNWTLNIRGNSTTTANSLMAVGQSATIAFLTTQGSSAYYQTALQVDGASVSPKWQGGTTPSSGNASGVDIYGLTLIKTSQGTFSAFESQAQFK
jgi:hypothetical protein